ncbi:glycerol dehydratase reactivase beta/small subunit family protein [Alicyclobacillus acidoterrestris]|uniref:Glycerol dehydratase reactivase beta/small subunit family protein n=1 Tax=Alicyclobacillus acidoterrestris (strain ATCC 49025 / DSM 3922 / CIP 106132 / NCIMB 13137 / GD3B) TaxID=1356854 RepID=T0DML8_ALIAG|nr:glycerol dehydratase reactivase beta/small subunit family protein [Alicyclobacillus acidoterrestris]EPZ52557.1 hypothetical protein N007_20415 [Alicyclobacillus acidoterrestris ATCC 49025]UNO47289.1 glycerol dehydratase reactivase beta/small subunit family protein [Alicyclobacillus acidoterrestris]
MNNEIYLPIICSPAVSLADIQDLCAGLEEEGVPYQCEQMAQEQQASEFGAIAALKSPLFIGIGVDRHLNCSLSHQNLPGNKEYITGSRHGLRQFGRNCGRLAKGLPLVMGGIENA